MSEDHSRAECQRAFRAAWHYATAVYPNPAALVRELMRTATCDGHRDLSALRAAIAADVGPAAMSRLQDYCETPTDVARASQATFHHGAWVRQELAKAMPWPRDVIAWLFGV